ncbi:uncharacterized protein LAESUDRAFT_429302 [Laetiporus sulphureus 93-53]|uniref:Uncharacterized protein n=1 Tax=Laetiporus sulphureus 93-53 TaxID=1314785 RepID=A0A165GM05_9APHY|nr:uncharacterized protein LAESUDRAFT_429302 [Laetiporus sulphureus 93-53]KZT10536.1 hypothetical protein LAESUDRAFT_429302 [Laetiporus sulphureus 93-53]
MRSHSARGLSLLQLSVCSLSDLIISWPTHCPHRSYHFHGVTKPRTTTKHAKPTKEPESLKIASLSLSHHSSVDRWQVPGKPSDKNMSTRPHRMCQAPGLLGLAGLHQSPVLNGEQPSAYLGKRQGQRMHDKEELLFSHLRRSLSASATILLMKPILPFTLCVLASLQATASLPIADTIAYGFAEEPACGSTMSF